MPVMHARIVRLTCDDKQPERAFFRHAYPIVTLVAIAALLAPTILCAAPADMNAAERDCCDHMEQECGQASLSACCAFVPNTAIASTTPVQKSSSFSGLEIQNYTITFLNTVFTAANTSMDWSDPDFSPPRSSSFNSIQILRI